MMPVMVKAGDGVRPAMCRELLLQRTNGKRTALTATDKALAKAANRTLVLDYLDAVCVSAEVSLLAAIEAMLSGAAEQALDKPVLAALVALGSKNALPNRSTIYAWAKKRRDLGAVGLINQNRGRARGELGWEATAVELYNQPSCVGFANVHRQLVEVLGFSCSYQQVQAYLKALPSQLGAKSAGRIGKNLRRLTQSDYVRRTTVNMQVGDIYVADGYRADVYIAHPVTGDLFRAELSVCMDIKSRFITGWRIDEHEGSFAVQCMWAEAFSRYNHVPPFIYVDNGSGYKNSFVDDVIDGFYQRAGVVEVIHSIPGNPHGKGWIERFFRTMKEDFLRMWMPEFYCGHEMAAEVRNRVVREVKAGRLVLPSVRQFADAFNAWLDRYHSRPHPEYSGRSKADVWAGLKPLPPAYSLGELRLQSVQLLVRRGSITHGKRAYRHAELIAFNGQRVLLNYDMMDDSVAIVRMLDGTFVCDAHLVVAMDVVAPNRLEEKRIVRADEAVKRLERKIAEQKKRSGQVIDAELVASSAIAYLADDSDEDDIILDLTGDCYE